MEFNINLHWASGQGNEFFLIVKFCTGTPGNKCSGATRIGVSSSQVIPDSKMTASSQQSDLTKPSYGRLNGVLGNGWCAGTASSTHDWLQVDLGRTVKVCSLFAQGEVNGNRWVTDFKLRYSTDGSSWRYYMNANGAQVVRFFNLNIFDSLYRDAIFLPVNSSIRHLHISLNSIHLLSPLKFSITVYFFYFSWVLKSCLVNLKTMLLANAEGGRMPSL